MSEYICPAREKCDLAIFVKELEKSLNSTLVLVKVNSILLGFFITTLIAKTFF